MFLKLSMETLLLPSLLIMFGSCCNILKHPEMREYYLKSRRDLPNTACDQSSNDSLLKVSYKEEVLKQCEKIADKSIFDLIEAGEPMNRTGVETKDIITIKEVMKFFKNDDGTLNEINLQVPGVKDDVQVFQCAEKEDKIIYIENIKHFDIFIFEKRKCDDDIKIRMAVFPLQPRWNMKRRLLNILEYNSGKRNKNVKDSIRVEGYENDFIRGLLGKSGKLQPSNEICELTNFDLVRLCASIFYFFKTWFTGNMQKEPPLYYEIRRPTYDTICQTLPIIMMSTDYGPLEKLDGQKVIHVKAWPCAVNSEWDKPNFYVTADNRRPFPIFYVIEDIKEKFYVTMKLKNSRSVYDAFLKKESDHEEKAHTEFDNKEEAAAESDNKEEAAAESDNKEEAAAEFDNNEEAAAKSGCKEVSDTKSDCKEDSAAK